MEPVNSKILEHGLNRDIGMASQLWWELYRRLNAGERLPDSLRISLLVDLQSFVREDRSFLTGIG